MFLFSVVICTYNRAALLARALDSLARQTLERDAFEVIVVDNNSTDTTAELVGRYPWVRYLFERQVGVAYARNSGWRAAQGTYIAFTDDDCVLPEAWLATAAALATERAPDLFGGPYIAYFDSLRPRWFKEAYGSFPGSTVAHSLAAEESLSGGSFFVQRSILGRLSGFDTSLGVAGALRAVGEEAALLEKVRAQLPEAQIYYDPALYVYHLVQPRKMSLRSQSRQMVISGFYCYPIFLRARLGKLASWQGSLISMLRLGVLVAESAVALLIRDRQRYPFWQNYLWERSFRHFLAIGIVFARATLAGPAERTVREQ